MVAGWRRMRQRRRGFSLLLRPGAAADIQCCLAASERPSILPAATGGPWRRCRLAGVPALRFPVPAGLTARRASVPVVLSAAMVAAFGQSVGLWAPGGQAGDPDAPVGLGTARGAPTAPPEAATAVPAPAKVATTPPSPQPPPAAITMQAPVAPAHVAIPGAARPARRVTSPRPVVRPAADVAPAPGPLQKQVAAIADEIRWNCRGTGVGLRLAGDRSGPGPGPGPGATAPRPGG